MDKGFRNKKLASLGQERLGVTLLARQQEPKGEGPSFWQRTLDRVRKPTLGVISVLTEYFGIPHLLVKTDWGLYRRTGAKATAFTLARYFNRVLGKEPLNIARYAV